MARHPDPVVQAIMILARHGRAIREAEAAAVANEQLATDSAAAAGADSTLTDERKVILYPTADVSNGGGV